MSWKDICPMNEKIKFIADVLKGERTMASICRHYGISRKTGYKLVNRYEKEGPTGIEERSRARNAPYGTSNDKIEIILAYKHKYIDWGPKKIKLKLHEDHPNIAWPSASTMGEILKKHNMVKPRRKRSRVPPFRHPFNNCDKANKVWSADFKGQFKLGNNKMCFPLTITDNYSRYIISCFGLKSTKTEGVMEIYKLAFQTFRLPDSIRTDNGSPFAATTIGGLTRLSIWLLKLDIIPERIEPGKPEQNGRHERMHRTLKQATANPPDINFKRQNAAFDRFIKIYNLCNRLHTSAGLSPQGGKN